MKRRDFLAWLYRLVWAVWGLVALWGLRRFLAPKERGLGRAVADFWVRVGSLDELPPRSSRLVHLGERPVLLIRLDERRVVALSALCTHLRCGLKWDPENGRIRCPCHGALFDLSGNVLQGPPRRPLPRFPVQIRNRVIFVRREAL